MNIVSLRNSSQFATPVFLETSERSIFVSEFKDVVLSGRNIHYPNCLLQLSDNSIVNPYDEKVMSLNKDSFYDNNLWDGPFIQPTETVDGPVFFFVYNVDNYFHFIYDTLPILNSYFETKKSNPSLQLVLQTSHPTKKELHPFVREFLQAVNVDSYSFAKENTLYKSMFVSTSYTHGGFSNSPPSPLAYTIWKSINPPTLAEVYPKRFYISRRTWVHGNTTNIGTNYTVKRKCMNEELLVSVLRKYNIEEVFTELATTEQKIKLFSEAELVVGIIGGGMCNLLFAPSATKSLCIVTPEFLEINERFKYSMENTNILYSRSADLLPFTGKFSLYTRVKVKTTGFVGEVLECKDTQVRVALSGNDVAGFSQDFPMREEWFQEDELEALDKGLNSPFLVDIQKFESDLNTLLNRN